MAPRSRTILSTVGSDAEVVEDDDVALAQLRTQDNYGSIVYIHTSKDNLYWIDTAAQDVKLSPNPINLTTIK